MQSLEEQINELIMLSGNTLSTAQEIIELVLKSKESILLNKEDFNRVFDGFGIYVFECKSSKEDEILLEKLRQIYIKEF